MADRHISLDDFAGDWSIRRRIDDHRAVSTLTFTGRATLAPDTEGLSYAETGTLTLPDGTALTAERRYLWRASGAGIAVLFDDGRPFHHFGTGQPEAAHWCDPDSYRVAYDFSAWPFWAVTWDVTGPRKDYRMQSHYSR